MAKAQSDLEKKYPDLTRLFAAKDQARMVRAQCSPTEKFQTVQKLNEVTTVLKRAQIVNRPGIKRTK